MSLCLSALPPLLMFHAVVELEPYPLLVHRTVFKLLPSSILLSL